jgi:chromosome partitioning protein
MCKTLLIACQKGGVGKTTTAVNLSVALALMGKKVLLVDTDAQGCVGIAFGLERGDLYQGIYELIVHRKGVEDVVYDDTDIPNLHLILNNIWSTLAEVSYNDASRNHRRLYEALRPVKNEFDYIIIDSPPSINDITMNCILASDSVIIPLQAEYYVMKVIEPFIKMIASVQDSIHTDFYIEGYLITMFDARTTASEEVVNIAKKRFGDQVFSVVIPRSIDLARVIYMGKPLNLYKPTLTRGGKAYRDLAKIIIEREGIQSEEEESYSGGV